MTTPRFSTWPAWLAAAVRLATGASLVALALLATGAEMAFAQSKTTIEVLYPYPSLFKALHEELAKRFQAEHPQIEIRYRAPAEHYEDATQQMLRAAVAGNMPDVAYHGLNRVRIFVERGVACRSTPSSTRNRTGPHRAISLNPPASARWVARSMACPSPYRQQSSTTIPISWHAPAAIPRRSRKNGTPSSN